MDETKMKNIATALYFQVLICVMLYHSRSPMTMDEIRQIEFFHKHPEAYILTNIRELIARGIISAELLDHAEIEYHITEFGKYYLEKLLEDNDFKRLAEKVGGTQS